MKRVATLVVEHDIKLMVVLFPHNQRSFNPHTISPCPSQIFSRDSIAFAQCHSHNILLISCRIWTMTKLLFKMSFSYPRHSTVIFCSKHAPPYLITITLHHRCKEWTKTMMNMLWSKVITTNIKNNFGLNLREVRYLGHWRCEIVIISFVPEPTTR
jgi:hypothetical protein